MSIKPAGRQHNRTRRPATRIEYQHYYQKTIGYLELEQRLHLIQHKLNTVNDVLGLVAEELRHQHSSALEWIIILLIAFEILVFIFHDRLGLI
ncbi:MAG TPA: hypothetical protein ENN06_11840 [Desulfobacteraceae bacterium]|nr:hypothetical protein [Desulfobacteraceae bacterium]